MSKIVISGYYGFANAGDEAMLTAIIASLRSREGDVHLTVISGNPDVTSARHGVISLSRFNFLGIVAAVKDCDLLLSGGGSLLQDVTSKRSLLYYLFIIALGKLLKIKVMLFAQGIGPINSGFLRKLTKYVCSGADLITVRDKDSLYELKRLGVPEEKVTLTADSVLTLPRESTLDGRKILTNHGVPADKMLVAFSVRVWGDDDAYLLELAKAADFFVTHHHAHIIILPLQYPVDLEACEKLQQFMALRKESTVLDASFDTSQFLSLMGNFDLLIGMRLHALIFAAVMETPFAAVSYDPKIDGFVKDIAGISAGKVGELQAEKIIFAAEKALRPQNEKRDLLNELRKKSMLNVQKAFALLNIKLGD